MPSFASVNRILKYYYYGGGWCASVCVCVLFILYQIFRFAALNYCQNSHSSATLDHSTHWAS